MDLEERPTRVEFGKCEFTSLTITPLKVPQLASWTRSIIPTSMRFQAPFVSMSLIKRGQLSTIYQIFLNLFCRSSWPIPIQSVKLWFLWWFSVIFVHVLDPLNGDAAAMYLHKPEEYKKKVSGKKLATFSQFSFKFQHFRLRQTVRDRGGASGDRKARTKFRRREQYEWFQRGRDERHGVITSRDIFIEKFFKL